MESLYTSVPALAVVGGIAAAAIWTDCRQRRVPNTLVLAGLGAGIAVQVAAHGVAGLALAAAGAALGLLCLLPFHAGGALGAGDVKLMAAMGAVLGPAGALAAALLTLVAGAVLGGAWLGWNRLREPAGAQAPAGYTLSGVPVPATRGVPYAVAIGVGSVLTAIGIRPW